ncbi:MAG: VanZ family protein [Saccharofermentanales bacterium]
MDKNRNSLQLIIKLLMILFCFLVSQIFCYFILDDILVDFFRSGPIVYIINRILIAISLYIISIAIYNREINKMQIDVLFMLYSAFVLVFLFLKGNSYTANDFHINLNPISIITDFETSNNAVSLLLGNIILYIPFGGYFLYKFRNPQKRYCVLLFTIPLFSETIQLFAGVGVLDINDIILNSIGIIIGIALHRMFTKKKKSKTIY